MRIETALNIKMFAASDLYGGSGLAAFRLLQGLQTLGVPTQLLVQDKRSIEENVIAPRSLFCKALARLSPLLDPLPKLAYPKRHRDAWSCGFLPNPCLPFSELNLGDIINLHWVGAGVLPIKALVRLNRPIVWTLHDSWPFTGGCHIPYDCRRFEKECGACPQLRSWREHDLSRIIWECKARSWQALDMTIVAPSNWLAAIARASSLFRHLPVEVIPNGLDTTIFNVANKLEARRRLRLPETSWLILFFAMGGVRNWNKGADLLRESLKIIQAVRPHDKFVLVTAGTRSPAPADYFPVPCINLGRVDDDEQKRWMYAAADVTAVSSRSESLGYVAMESMACGTPCVGFSVGGLPDLIDHKINGFLVEPYLVNDFAEGIFWLLNDQKRMGNVSLAAREKISSRFCQINVAKQYNELFVRVLDETPM